MSHIIETRPPRAGRGEPMQIVDSREKILESYGDYLSDESRYGPPSAERLVFPRDEEQVATTLAEAAASGQSVTLSSARTGIVGGAVPVGGTLLSLVEMNRILGLRRLEDGRFAVRVEPGLSLADLGERLASRDLGLEAEGLDDAARGDLEAFVSDERGWFYPPDPTEDTAHVGATVATNASGARSFRYGATRRHVNAVRLCLTSGGVIAVERGDCTASDRTFALARQDGTRVDIAVPDYSMPSTKNAAGYYAAAGMDIVDLIIGSEGTLGVITEVELVLTGAPEGILSALAFFGSDEDAIAFVGDVRGDGRAADGTGGAAGGEGPPEAPSVAPLSLEFFDSMSFDFLRGRKVEEGSSSEIPELPDGARAGVLFEQSYEEETLLDIYEAWEAALSAHGSSMDDTWGGMEEAELSKLKALRHSIAEQVNGVVARAKSVHPEIHKVGTDAAVPPERLEEMFRFYRSELEGTGLSYVIFGHVGDSHLHLNIMPADPDELKRGKELALGFARKAVELGGTVSAEHGIGRLKHDFLRAQYGDEGLSQMAEVKRAFDPPGILNRDVMFPAELLEGGWGEA